MSDRAAAAEATSAGKDGAAFDVLVENLAFPEGPAFDLEGDLWWVELAAGVLGSRSRGGAIHRHVVGGRPNGIAVDGDGRVWFCDSGLNAIRRLDPETGQVVSVLEAADGRPLQKPNDLAFDRAGNLVFTCPGDSRAQPTGLVCCLRPDGDVRVVAEGLFFPNGLAFTAGEEQLIIAETRRQRLWSGRWDSAEARWSASRILARTGGSIGPDGLALAANGNLYVAVHGSTEVEIKTPTGSASGVLSLTGGNPTNCAFDPSGELGLVVADAGAGRLISYPGEGPGLPLAMPSIPSIAQRREP